jgi:hypothetical protein
MEFKHPEIMENAKNFFYTEKSKSYYGEDEDQ